MPAFEYIAVDAKGKEKKGALSADSPRAVRQQLRDMRLTPLRVNELGETGSSNSRRLAGTKSGKQHGKAVGRQKMTTMELAVTTRQFATLLDSGLPIEQALTGLIEQAERQSLKTILTGVRSTVMEGGSLADGMRLFPKAFTELYVASVAAGEQTGHLETVLENLAEYTEARQEMEQSVGSALVYPLALVIISIGILILLMTLVVPKVVGVFEDRGQELPPLTKAVIAISDFIVNNGFLLFGFLAALGYVIYTVLKQPGPQYWLHSTILKTPGLKRLSRSLNTARMARTLSILIGSGVPLISAIRSAADVMTNLVMRRSLTTVAEEVEQGAGLSQSLARTGVFPPLLTQMIASGESSGRIDVMLEKSANSLEREAQSKISTALSLFQPLVTVFMGIMVLIIVVAILLPILNMNQLI